MITRLLSPASRPVAWKGWAIGLFATLNFSIAPPIIKTIINLGVNPNTLLMLRYTAATLLLFGAIGEEMLFRGYGFQVLMNTLGPFATILPVGVLFGVAHSGNQNFTGMGLANTIGWGILLGAAFYRSGDLWLPIGIHFAWNWTLPLFGVNLSGFTMGVTGLATRWHTTALWSGGAYGPEASILTTLVLFGLAYFLWKAPIEHQKAVLLGSLEED